MAETNVEGVELTHPLALALAQIAGKARWIGYHEQKLSGADAKLTKAARADADTIDRAALEIERLQARLGVEARDPEHTAPAWEEADV